MLLHRVIAGTLLPQHLDVHFSLLRTVKLRKIDVLGTSAHDVAILDGKEATVSTNHALDMPTGVVAGGSIARQEVCMRIGGIEWSDAIKRLHKIRLHAGQPLVYHDSTGRMRQNNRCQAIGHRAAFDGSVHVFGNIDELVRGSR